MGEPVNTFMVVILKPFGIEVTVGSSVFFFVIILMIIFCFPECSGRRDSGYNFISFLFQQTNKLFCNCFLLHVEIKYLGAVLISLVWPLLVELCRVMDFEEQPCQLLK